MLTIENSMSKLLCAASLALSCLPYTLMGEEKPPRWRVTVSTTTSDSTLKENIQSFVERELRSLGDVEVVASSESNPRFELVLTPLILESKANKRAGVAIAYSFISNLRIELMPLFDKSAAGKEFLQYVADTFGSNLSVSGPGIIVGAIGDLRESCGDIVTSFDRQMLAPVRKEWEELQKAIKR